MMSLNWRLGMGMRQLGGIFWVFQGSFLVVFCSLFSMFFVGVWNKYLVLELISFSGFDLFV